MHEPEQVAVVFVLERAQHRELSRDPLVGAGGTGVAAMTEVTTANIAMIMAAPIAAILTRRRVAGFGFIIVSFLSPPGGAMPGVGREPRQAASSGCAYA